MLLYSECIFSVVFAPGRFYLFDEGMFAVGK